MNVGPSGFNNAPVTRALVIACTLFTIIFGTQGRANQLGWSYQVFLLFSFVLSLLLAVLALQLIKGRQLGGKALQMPVRRFF
uniref:Rhomboid-like protein 18 isoform X2 n=1 Tax=Nicotiana tabacum TaxID=4097 RepID=A0A1S3YP60_TOBAC|nr:PREDICTED: rhomboid-like protein 18 isoform X2 [Nicotiana tabacum]